MIMQMHTPNKMKLHGKEHWIMSNLENQ